jgi:Zn-dependent protease
MNLAWLAEGLLQYLILVFAITVHEWAHAWSANRCGDPTARLLGRMTLNPVKHMDVIGTVTIPLLSILMPGSIALLGWGKPVPVVPGNFHRPTRDDVLVSLAGPLSNLATTLVALALVRALLFLPGTLADNAIAYVVWPLASLSFFLAFFNLLPIPPLDGSHLLRATLNYESRQVYDRMAGLGFILLLVLINTPVWSVFNRMIGGIYGVLQLLYGLG